MADTRRNLNKTQFGEHLGEVAHEMGLHPSLGGTQVPEVIEGRVAKHVMHQAGIRQTKRGVDAPHIATGGYQEQQESDFSYPRGEVMTSQRHLHTPTLHRYATEGPPEHDEERSSYSPEHHIGGEIFVGDPSSEPAPYDPEHYGHGGKRWLAEGHHRVVVDRLAR